MVKISVIIATYNAGKTIRKALESVKNQLLQDWECIVVDGASKDNTIEIANEYTQKDVRFRYISEPDKGIYDAFNKGWKLAKGEWIYYLGADDELLPEGLQGLLSVAEAKYCDIAYGDMMNVYEDGSTLLVHHLNNSALPYRVPGGHQAIITRKSAIMEIGGFDDSIKIAADKDLFIRLYLNKYVFKGVDNVCVSKFSYGGVSTRTVGSTIKDNVKIWRKNKMGIDYILVFISRLFWLKTKQILGIKRSLHGICNNSANRTGSEI